MAKFNRTVLAALLLGLSVSATAGFKTIVQAYEVPLSLLRIPASTNGFVTFKECLECDEFTVSVTEKTEYIINGKPLLLRDFRTSMFKVRDRESEIVTVKRHLGSNTITAIKVAL